jgi:hypothetical protein
MSNKHNSGTQLSIESIVIEQLKKGLKCELSKQTVPIEDTNAVFEFDFFNKEERIIGEIYAGIDKLKAGQKRKVGNDCFKLISAEKTFGGNWNKYIVFVDDNIKKIFDERSRSWLSKSIDKWGIKLELVNLTEEKFSEIKKAKDKQGKF